MSQIAFRIDRLPSTPMLKKILLLAGVGWMFDAMDQGMVSGVMAAITTDWGLVPDQLALLSSIGMLGMALGAALSGMAADKWGRRAVIMVTLIIYGVASGLAGFATSFPMLLCASISDRLRIGRRTPGSLDIDQ